MMPYEAVKSPLTRFLGSSITSSGARVEALSSCLDRIPDKSRSLLKLRYFDGYNCIEIAEKIGIELNTVYKRLSRLHQGLRVCIEQKNRTDSGHL